MSPARRHRLACMVPGCGRSFAARGNLQAVICARHWSLVDRRIRKLATAIRRKARREGWTPRLVGMDARVFDLGLRQAIERGMGL